MAMNILADAMVLMDFSGEEGAHFFSRNEYMYELAKKLSCPFSQDAIMFGKFSILHVKSKS